MSYTKSDSTFARHKISITKGIHSSESITATPVHLGDGDEEEYEKHGDLTGKIKRALRLASGSFFP